MIIDSAGYGEPVRAGTDRNARGLRCGGESYRLQSVGLWKTSVGGTSLSVAKGVVCRRLHALRYAQGRATRYCCDELPEKKPTSPRPSLRSGTCHPSLLRRVAREEAYHAGVDDQYHRADRGRRQTVGYRHHGSDGGAENHPGRHCQQDPTDGPDQVQADADPDQRAEQGSADPTDDDEPWFDTVRIHQARTDRGKEGRDHGGQQQDRRQRVSAAPQASMATA